MRIIGGRLKGKVINLPAGYKARPTTYFAREGLFNILDNEYELEGLQVLDLFGGTGAVSFEFASRGARRVYCVEMVRENARKAGASNATINNWTGMLCAAFDNAVEEDLLRENPWKRYKRLPVRHGSRKGSKEDFQKVYAELPEWMQWACRKQREKRISC